MLPQGVTVTQPFKGVWHIIISRDGTKVGVVNGDSVIGYTARNRGGQVVGHGLHSAQEALDALMAEMSDLS